MAYEPRHKRPWQPTEKPAVSGVLLKNPIEHLKEWLFRWLTTKLGALLAGIIVLASTTWWQWDKVEKLPGFIWISERFDDIKPLPQASGKSFSIVLARLANDKDGKHRIVMSEALSRHSGIEVLIAPRIVAPDGNGNLREATPLQNLGAIRSS